MVEESATAGPCSVATTQGADADVCGENASVYRERACTVFPQQSGNRNVTALKPSSSYSFPKAPSTFNGPPANNSDSSNISPSTTQEDRWLEQLRKRPPEILSERDLRLVCNRVKAILIEENNVQPVPSPVTICGDIHGQFYDLLELLDVGGQVPDTNYVFMGDYVDRGHNSLETFQYLLILKLRYPSHVTLLRGNHESRQITQVYGFYDECMRKYGNANPWRFCTDVFDYLALAAIIDGRVFCVHGGLSPSVRLIDQLRLINRVQEIPQNGPFGDIVWSDPENIESWAINPRGAGWLFGRRPVEDFNHVNDIELIARAHQLAMEGYQFMFGPESALVTVWSAPNYCYRCGNVAAILRLNPDMSKKFLIFRDTAESRQSVASRATVPYFL